MLARAKLANPSSHTQLIRAELILTAVRAYGLSAIAQANNSLRLIAVDADMTARNGSPGTVGI